MKETKQYFRLKYLLFITVLISMLTVLPGIVPTIDTYAQSIWGANDLFKETSTILSTNQLAPDFVPSEKPAQLRLYLPWKDGEKGWHEPQGRSSGLSFESAPSRYDGRSPEW